MLKFEREKTTTKRDITVINKIDFAAKNLTSNAGIYLLLENAKANGIFELIDTDLVFDNESTNKIKMNHIKAMLCGHFIGIDKLERLKLLQGDPLITEFDISLSAMLQTLDVCVSQAVQNQLAPLEFLAVLLDESGLYFDHELERRNQQRQILRLAQSGCDSNKALAHFDFSTAPGINRTLIQDLASCVFIQRHENILMCGPSGVGKSHLAQGLALEALKRDFRVLVKSTDHLLQDLQVARANGSYSRLLSRLVSCDLLVLDDFGLQLTSPQGAQDIYEIITERYERGSLIITSNRAFEEWAEVFANDLLASAALDRLTYHAHTLIIRGDSFRQRSRRSLSAALPAGKENQMVKSIPETTTNQKS